MLLDNRVAIITGGTGALGRSVTEYFLAQGARVALPYVVDAEVPLLEQRIGGAGKFSERLLLRKLDISHENQLRGFIAEVVTKWGRIDALANLVGGFWGGKTIAETSLDEWQAMFELNLKTAFLSCKHVVPAMTQAQYGRIVSVTSRSGLQGAGDFAAYAVSKGAVATLTSSLAQEVLEHGILVNAVAPSTIDTPANRAAMPKARHERWVQPEEIARTIGFLCSDQCQATSGAVIPVYGRA